MSEFRARISRLRMKNGGADVHIIEGFAAPKDEEETVAETLLRSAREVVEEDRTAAFVLVAFGRDGSTSFNWRITDDCPLSRTMMPPYISELTRRYVLTTQVASERFSEMFEWVE